MDVIKRINQLMEDRNLSDYQLSKMSGLSISTIANIHRRNTIPSIPTLEAICNAFGITLSQFFYEDTDAVTLTSSQKMLFSRWISLTDTQKDLVFKLIEQMK